MMKKYIVFGGSSGIGSSIVTTLLKEGHNVFVFDKQRPENSDLDYCHVNLEHPEECFITVKKSIR